MTKKIFYLQAAALVSSAVFSLLSISFSFDISLISVAISLIFTLLTFRIGLLQFQKTKNAALLPVVRKLYEYLPFVLLIAFVIRRAGTYGTPYVLDVISVIFWIIVTVSANILIFFLSDKRVYVQNADLESSRASLPPKKKNPIRKIILEGFSWIDAFIQAALIVLLVNIFIFQLYEIPSESMVPEFLIKDRVVVFKTPSGPKFPLSNVGLPSLRSYERGNIVVFRNPHYETTRKSEVKNFISQIVFMLSFTKVNLNVDEYGEMKADPLVKRVCGESGEQLVMLDGTLYARTKDTPDFLPVADDNLWAEWNIDGLSAGLKSKINRVPLSQSLYNTLIKVEDARNLFSLEDAKKEAIELSRTFSKAKSNFMPSTSNNSTINDEALNKTSTKTSSFLTEQEMNEYYLFSQNVTLTRKFLSSDIGQLWFTEYMTAWIQSIPKDLDMYEEAMYKLNIMAKIVFGKLIVRNTELILSGESVQSFAKDSILTDLLEQAENLHTYIVLNDSRNMPVFPKNTSTGEPQYISNNSYFLMGDNRFNSLDMRHSYETFYIPLSSYDPYSVRYYSNIEQREVSADRILGTTVFRFWPISRVGVPGLTAEKSR